MSLLTSTDVHCRGLAAAAAVVLAAVAVDPATTPLLRSAKGGATWTEERIGSGTPGVVTPGDGRGSFDMTTAPDVLGYFVGDYAGLDFAGGGLRPGFKPFHVRANSGNLTNRTDAFGTTASTSVP